MVLRQDIWTLWVYTLAPNYAFRDYFEAQVYAIWVHGGYYRGLNN